MKILVLGKQGQLAQSLQFVSSSEKNVELYCCGRPQVDLENGSGIAEAIHDFGPDIVINAAAYTNVDKAESEENTAFAINATGAGQVAKHAFAHGCPVIHISTDYVFDGTSSSPYTEDDQVNPINAYGRSKLEGELLVARFNPKHVIIRTAWVTSPYGTNFVKTMLRLGADRDVISVVDDQSGCPTSALDLAWALITICKKLEVDKNGDTYGLFNLANSGSTTWFGVARQIFAKSALFGGPVAQVDPVTSDNFPTVASRPRYSNLSLDKVGKIYGIKMRDWPDAIEDCVAQILLSEKTDGNDGF